MKASSVAALLGCAAIAPASAFTGGASLAVAGALRPRDARRRGAISSVQMMAIDPATVHSVGDYVNAVGSTGLDQAWLSHVMHGECLKSSAAWERCALSMAWMCSSGMPPHCA